MQLSFNLKAMFGLCMCLMLWHMMFLHTFLLGSGIVLAFLGYKYFKGNISVFDVLFASSFLLNLWYVVGLDINVRQYDYFNFFMHAVYFVENDFFVKNPINYLQAVYYQPPLWGGVTGGITKIGMILGVLREQAFDVVRFVSLFCISGVGIVAYRLFKLFDFKRNVLIFGYGVFLFLPIHTMMSGFNNNDTLVYFLMTMIIYQGYNWYVYGGYKRAFIIAGLLVLAGMTKFSGLMVVAYLAMLGVAILINKRNAFDKKAWFEFLIIAFGVLIGFSWGGFLLYHNFPLVPPPQDVSYQAMSRFDIYTRFFDFSNIGELFVDLKYGIVEPNVWLALVKTSIFGEWKWNGGIFAYILYFSTILLDILLVYGFLGLFKYKVGKDFGFNLAIIVFVLAVFISWGLFWISYPYFCSTEFRYIVSLVPVSFVGLMSLLSQKNLPKWVNISLASLSVVFVIAKIIVYLSTI